MHVTEGLLLSLLLLTASTLQISQLSGTLGEDVQLVCTQTTQQYENSAFDCVNSTCTLDWSFDNTSISSSAKYYLSNSTSSNYCNLTASSTQLYQTANFSAVTRNHVCEVHRLTIKKFNSSDIGLYSCNYSYNSSLSTYYPPSPRTSFDFNFEGTSETLDNGQTVLHSAMNITGAPNQTVTYAERNYQDPAVYRSNYVSQVYERLLTHCVASGGNITWLARACVEDYPVNVNNINYYDTTFDKCGQFPLMSLEEFLKADHWRCFEVTTLYSYPYPNVTESMLAVKRVCPPDNFQLLCTVGNYTGDTKSRELNIQKEGYFSSYNQRYWDYSVSDGWAFAFGIIFLVLFTIIGFSCLLFAFIILAVCRQKS